MGVLLVESLEDPASIGIAGALRARPGWHATGKQFQARPVWKGPGALDPVLVTIAELHIRAEALDADLAGAGMAADAIIFLSKHKSESGRPTLTAHPVGNYAEALYGGGAGRISPSAGGLLTEALRHLARASADAAYETEVAFEATHHGPLLGAPAVFVELGSSEAQWIDRAGHEVLADAVSRLLARIPPSYPILIGLGGGHYVPRFTEAALTKEVHFAHFVPTHYATKIEDPARTVQELVRASPGLSGYYYHDGTLPKPVRERWFSAFEAAGIPARQSREWAPLTPAA